MVMVLVFGYMGMNKATGAWKSRKEDENGADNTDIEGNNERPYQQTYLHDVTKQGKKMRSIVFKY